LSSLFLRATALNARNEIDNPEPDPKQPYSRQDGVFALGGPIKRNKLWFFSSFEYVNEGASVAYSANSRTQLNALSQLAAQGLIPGVNSISVPTSVGVPFHDTLFTTRFDYAQSEKSQWFLRGSIDRNNTQNNLVQQATLPSTGAFTRSNFYSVLLDNQFQFSPTWLSNLTLQANGFANSQTRNSDIGQALAFPFSATSQTTSGFETYGDNQFITPITAFPILRNQQKYQVRYDVAHSMRAHSPHFGINFIHEPVFGGAFAGTPENLHGFTFDPTFYLANPQQFTDDYNCTANASPNTTCQDSGAVNGSFSQNVQRLGVYAQDSWRITPSFTLNYGLRYDTTFGLFKANGVDQSHNWSFQELQTLGIPLVNGIPHDYREAFAPRLGIAYAPSGSVNTVIRAGIGMYYNDLSQNGWVNAFQNVNGGPYSGQGAVIDPNYRTPYALQTSAAVEHRFGNSWLLNVQFEHQEGNHQYQRYEYVAGFTLPADAPNVSVFRSGNRSSYNGLAFQIQHSFSNLFELNAHYTLSSATTYGAVLGELFDYVNGVSDVNNAFAPGDHGPSGEDVRHRAVIAGILHLPGAFEVSTLSQFESARPFTLTTPVDINNDGNSLNDRAVVNGVQTTMDEFRGKAYIQIDLRVSRPIKFSDSVTLRPFAEFFNLFNRSNAGANYVTDISALPTPVNDLSNATSLCMNPPSCSVVQPITNLNQLKFPAGTLGDFFGPGTNVGIPFAAQFGFQLTF
jgi:outer membrane receptor protein involved in Fe transport